MLFEYLAEEVLAGAAEPERELLSIAARLPHVSPALLGELGRDDLAGHLAPIGDAGIFLERDMSVADRYRASVLGGSSYAVSCQRHRARSSRPPFGRSAGSVRWRAPSCCAPRSATPGSLSTW